MNGAAEKRRTTTEESRECLSARCRNKTSSSTRKIIEVGDKWVKFRVTLDPGAEEHVMLEVMFPRVKLERETAPKRFVRVDGGGI